MPAHAAKPVPGRLRAAASLVLT
ncbi:MAG: hypothetical protein JWQ75_2491, partial [Pseudarthrobacter sp.]|nr:hypothetical protein [Pseudarthrobacter sp.]